jgi:hypothetical protein
MSTQTSNCKDPNGAKHLSHLHYRFVVDPANMAPNNIDFVCKSHSIDCFITELGIDNSLGNSTYTTTTHAKEEILDNHRQACVVFLWTFNQR